MTWLKNLKNKSLDSQKSQILIIYQKMNKNSNNLKESRENFKMHTIKLIYTSKQ